MSDDSKLVTEVNNTIKLDNNENNNNTSDSMIQLMKKVSIIQQPGSLTKTYLYNFNVSKRYKIYKLLGLVLNILNHFFSTFYYIISKPVLLFTQNKLTIYINYYLPRASYKLSRRYL